MTGNLKPHELFLLCDFKIHWPFSMYKWVFWPTWFCNLLCWSSGKYWLLALQCSSGEEHGTDWNELIKHHRYNIITKVNVVGKAFQYFKSTQPRTNSNLFFQALISPRLYELLAIYFEATDSSMFIFLGGGWSSESTQICVSIVLTTVSHQCILKTHQVQHATHTTEQELFLQPPQLVSKVLSSHFITQNGKNMCPSTAH